MSVDKDRRQYAAEIFELLVAMTAPDWWDWEPIANKAFEAAEAFSRVAEARLASGVQGEAVVTAEATVVRVPDAPTNAPTGVTPTSLSR
jgi:hypothetical protein